MYLAEKVRNTLRRLLQHYGTENVKKHLWNNEFSRGRWDCLDRTPGDYVYSYVEKYASNGSILDLGCGSGSTGNELDETSYRHYRGVDISDVAIEKARRRTEENHRVEKNRYCQADIFGYVPTQQYDVILFRDSIYYIPRGQIIAMLDRYSQFLKEGGVFIVRITNGSDDKFKTIVDTIESNFEVKEKYVFERPDAIIMIFRQAGNGSSPRRGCVLPLPMIATRADPNRDFSRD
jgi:SAM-dependent methyltransferase